MGFDFNFSQNLQIAITIKRSHRFKLSSSLFKAFKGIF